MIVLDEQLNDAQIALDIARWYKGAVINILQLRPHTHVLDDVIPTLLRTVKQPTFVTINHKDFWRVIPASDHCCVICCRLSSTQMYQVPQLLREVISLPEFSTKRARMGYVISVTPRGIESYHAT